MKTFFPFLLAAGVLVGSALAQTGAPVTITESATDFTLANRVITARVLKRNGDLASLKFRDAEMRSATNISPLIWQAEEKRR